MKRLTLATLGALAVLMSAQALAQNMEGPYTILPKTGSSLGQLNLTRNISYNGKYADWEKPAFDLRCSFQTTGDNIPMQIITENFAPASGSDIAGQYVIKHPGAVFLEFKGKAFNKSAYPIINAINQDYNYSSYGKRILIVECTYYTK